MPLFAPHAPRSPSRCVAAVASSAPPATAGVAEFLSTPAGRFAAAALELAGDDGVWGATPPSALPPALSSLRASSADATSAFPLPTPRIEAWRQTDVAGLLAHPPVPAPGLQDAAIFRAAGAVSGAARAAPRGGLLAVVVDGVIERIEVGEAKRDDEDDSDTEDERDADEGSERGAVDGGGEAERRGCEAARRRQRRLEWSLTPSGLGAFLYDVGGGQNESGSGGESERSLSGGGDAKDAPGHAGVRKDASFARPVTSPPLFARSPLGYFGRLAEAPEEAAEVTFGLASQPTGARAPERQARGGFFGAVSGALARDALVLWIGEGAKVPGALRVVHARTVHKGGRRSARRSENGDGRGPRVEVCAPRIAALLERGARAALLEEALEVHVQEPAEGENVDGAGDALVRVRIRSYFERGGNGGGGDPAGGERSGEDADWPLPGLVWTPETAGCLEPGSSDALESLDSEEEDDEDAGEEDFGVLHGGGSRSALRFSPDGSPLQRRPRVPSPPPRAGARSPSRLSLPVLEAFLDDDARLSHSVVSLLHPSAAEMRATVVDQAASSTYALVECRLGGSMVRHEADVLQLGPSTHTRLRHLHVAGHGSLHEARTRLELRHPDGTADQLHKAVVASDRGKGVFDGAVAVGQLAQRTDAAQLTRALLLAPKATFHAKPNLRIVADDVKCTHGASVADLDPDGSFYLRTRGVDAKTARGMLVRAFAAEIVEELGESDVVSRVARAAFRELERAAEEGGER